MDISNAKNVDAEFEQRVQRDLAFLFEEYAANVTSNTVGAHRESEVTIAAGNVELRCAKNERDNHCDFTVGPLTDTECGSYFHVAFAASTGEDAATLNVPFSYSDGPTELSYIGLTDWLLS